MYVIQIKDSEGMVIQFPLKDTNGDGVADIKDISIATKALAAVLPDSLTIKVKSI